MRKPARSPICSWMLSSTRRSITWVRSTSSGGSSVPRSASCWRMVAIRSSTWLSMTTSLSTMAATRSNSTIWACRAVLISRPAHRPISLRCSLKCIVFTLSVARDAFVEKTVDTIAGNAAESLEDHLQEDAAVALVTGNRLEFVVVDPVTVDETELPAAAVIFKTAEGFQGSVTGEIMLPTADHAPLRVERPDEGHIRLIDAAILVFVERAGQGIEGVGLIAETVARVDHLAWLRLVIDQQATGVVVVLLGIPEYVTAQFPRITYPVHELGGISGTGVVVLFAALTFGLQQLHALILEIEDLAEAGAGALDAVAFQRPAGHPQGQLVGIADTVAAAEAIVAEQRVVAEGILVGIEQRLVILVAVGRVQVEGAGLQRLPQIAAEPAGVAVEIQPRIQAGYRNGAGGVGVGAVVIESQGRVPVLAIIEVQVVIGRLHPRRWSEVAPAVLHGIAESWAQADAVAGGTLKTHQVLVRGPDRAKGVKVHTVFTYQEAPVEIPVEIGVFGAIVQLQ